jgi:para-nitrobenzyl esterase
VLDPRIEASRNDRADGSGGAVVRTALGAYVGAVHDGVAVFKGIPYAQPPFGALRFQAPEPVRPHEGVLPCHDYGPTAPQAPYPPPLDDLFQEPMIPGRDCLTLNIWTPATGSGAGLPVMVWVHGGAFAHGSGAVSVYSGDQFARDGVVCVTINYRLGVDGFLLLDGVPANRGLLDQVAALEWVRDHIAAFGGDPARVTVAGESAGAMSISTLLAMPAAAGLFRQAITESGAAAHLISVPVARRVAAGLAAGLQIMPTAAAFAAVDEADLIAAQERFSAVLARDRDPQKWAELVLNAMPFEPTVDGEVVPGPPLELIRGGTGSGVRLLTGTNREEMTLFLAPTGVLERADDTALALTAGAYGLPADGLAVYRRQRPDASAGELIVDVVTDWFFRIPAIRVAEARAEAAAEAAVVLEVAAEPSYLYEFHWRTPQWDGRLGASHGLEVPFVFDALADPTAAPLVGKEPPQSLADAMHGAWVAFVTTGDPGWPAYADDRAVMIFGGPGQTVLDPRGATREAWTGRR